MELSQLYKHEKDNLERELFTDESAFGRRRLEVDQEEDRELGVDDVGGSVGLGAIGGGLYALPGYPGCGVFFTKSGEVLD